MDREREGGGLRRERHFDGRDMLCFRDRPRNALALPRPRGGPRPGGRGHRRRRPADRLARPLGPRGPDGARPAGGRDPPRRPRGGAVAQPAGIRRRAARGDPRRRDRRSRQHPRADRRTRLCAGRLRRGGAGPRAGPRRPPARARANPRAAAALRGGRGRGVRRPRRRRGRRAAAPAAVRGGGGDGDPALHLRDDGPAQGRDADASEPDPFDPALHGPVRPRPGGPFPHGRAGEPCDGDRGDPALDDGRRRLRDPGGGVRRARLPRPRGARTDDPHGDGPGDVQPLPAPGRFRRARPFGLADRGLWGRADAGGDDRRAGGRPAEPPPRQRLRRDGDDFSRHDLAPRAGRRPGPTASAARSPAPKSASSTRTAPTFRRARRAKS